MVERGRVRMELAMSFPEGLGFLWGGKISEQKCVCVYIYIKIYI